MNRPWDTRQYAKTASLQARAAADLLAALAIRPDEKILDFGCGMGNLTLEIAEIAHQGSVVGIDTSLSMIEQAKRNLRVRRLPNVEFLVATAADLRTDGSFDVVFSNSVLHWIKDQPRVLRALHQLLKSGGRLGFQFPLLDAAHPLISACQKAIDALGLAPRYSGWTFPWYVPESADGYADLLREASFRKVAVTRHETRFIFASASAARGFFDAVGLDLISRPLAPGEAGAFREEVHRILASLDTGEGVRLDFSRLYACAVA
ncbi:MAG: methyltransferase domain-containing protein [Betaproteobacteria bacterium]|nr:methyltransferase domain-containing protein [Betaproteobacteria bacterium]